MKKRLINALARLASLKYQEAYIVNGTATEYVSIEDMLEDVTSLCATSQQRKAIFTEIQLECLRKLGDEIIKLSPFFFDVDSRKLIFENENWAFLRNLAAECLALFDIHINHIRLEDID